MNVIDSMLMAAGLMRRYLSDQILRDITDVGRYLKPYVVAEGIPKLPNMEQLASNIAFGAVALLGARPVAYAQENGGELIREVRPQPGKAEEKSSHGKAELPMHTDMTYLRFPAESDHPIRAAAPDFLILSCIKNDLGIPTRLITVDQIKQALSNEELQALFSAKFTIRSPDSVVPSKSISGRSILYKHLVHGDMIRYNDVYCTAETKEAQKALDSLQAFIRDERTGEDIVLEPGKVLLFNNRQVLHGRGPIVEKENVNQDRWFKRVYAQRHDTDYSPSESNPFVQLA